MTILGTGTLNSKIFLAKRVLDYILRVCKYYGYSLQELTLLFDSLIMSLFTNAIEVWANIHFTKYLSQAQARNQDFIRGDANEAKVDQTTEMYFSLSDPFI